MKHHLNEKERLGIKGPHIGPLHIAIIILAGVILVSFILVTHESSVAYNNLLEVTNKYVISELAADSLKEASDDLTKQVQLFSVTQNRRYLEGYFTEISEHQHRENAVMTLENALSDTDAYGYLASALDFSDELTQREFYSMKLIVDAEGYAIGDNMEALRLIAISPADQALPPEEKIALAITLVHDDVYQRYDDQIDENVSLCVADLTSNLERIQEETSQILSQLRVRQQLLMGAFVFFVVLSSAAVIIFIILPLRKDVAQITKYEPLPMTGAFEIQYLARAYNIMYARTKEIGSRLRHAAEHDPLTGLFNRGAFEKLRETYEEQFYTLLLIDVDCFKEVNDTYGHRVGDQVLQNIASLLAHSFRASDFPCRIGGDEFAVIMADTPPAMKDVILEKTEQVLKGLNRAGDSLPQITLSIGIGFHAPGEDAAAVFNSADKALYHVKEHGRNGYAFFDGEDVITTR